MKILFDAIGAPPGSGGPEAHALEILSAWVRRYPQDDILVIGTPWARLDAQTLSSVRWIRWPNRRLPLRILGQLVLVPILMQLFRTRVLLVSLSVLSPLSPRRRSFVFAHDWRHLIRRDEFSLPRRAYRAIWLRSVKRAALTFCISNKTLEETRTFARDAKLLLVENGHDHALRWQAMDHIAASHSPILQSLAGKGRIVLTFGHRRNKRPELVIAALCKVSHKPHLIVLGATGDYRDELEKLALEKDIADRVHFPGFVSDEEYQRLVLHADCIVMASSDEGFGLPVAEALCLGRPVVVTAGSGFEKIFGGAVTVAAPDCEAIGDAIWAALDGAPITSPAYRGPTWREAVETVRAAISSANSS